MRWLIAILFVASLVIVDQFSIPRLLRPRIVAHDAERNRISDAMSRNEFETTDRVAWCYGRGG